MYYAQLDENNICVGVSDLSGEIIADNMIRIEEMNTDLIGKKYNNGNWEAVEPLKNKFESE